jgi:alpha-tubulin suppressor-like RCC1 family protein
VGLNGCTSNPIGAVTNTTFTAVAAGGIWNCGLVSGAAYCWGFNGYGNLGNNSTTNSSTPVAVAGGLTFASLTVGEAYTCGVTTGAAAYCWGDDDNGALGNDATGNLFPTPVAVLGGLTFTSLSAGGDNVCGVATGGAAYCWGDNVVGELGNGSTIISSSKPVSVAGGLNFRSVSAGRDHACGVTTGGAAYCWGDNEYGELGNGPTADTLNDSTVTLGTANSSTPVAVARGLSFASLSAGASFYTCGVTTVGAAYCWGQNSSGVLGNGSTTNGSTPVAVAGGLTFASLSAGASSTCGLTTGGAAYCWGDNSYGQLGDNSTTNSSTPIAVAGGLTFASLSTGESTCGVTTGGAAYCWGASEDGQLGNNSTTNSSVPVRVSSP